MKSCVLERDMEMCFLKAPDNSGLLDRLMGGWAQRAHSSHGWEKSSSQIVSQNKYLKTHTFSPCTPPSTHLHSFIWRSRRSSNKSRVVQKLRARVPRFHVRCSFFCILLLSRNAAGVCKYQERPQRLAPWSADVWRPASKLLFTPPCWLHTS